MKYLTIIFIAVALLFFGQGSTHRWLPDPSLTPGLADASLTIEKLKDPSFRTTSVRNVTEAEKRQVYARYHQDPKAAPCPCEVDHLISLEIGGSNDISNLWPQPYDLNVDGKNLGAHTKDRLENALAKAVRSGQISLADAQKSVAEDWTAAYVKWVGEFPDYKK